MPRVTLPRDMDWFGVLRDIAILWTLSFVGAMLVSLLDSAAFANRADPFKLMVTANQAAFLVGFTISASLGRRSRPRRLCHATVVALGIWLAGLLNVFLFRVAELKPWFQSIVLILFLMLMGVGLSLLLCPPKEGGNRTGTGCNGPGTFS